MCICVFLFFLKGKIELSPEGLHRSEVTDSDDTPSLISASFPSFAQASVCVCVCRGGLEVGVGGGFGFNLQTVAVCVPVL